MRRNFWAWTSNLCRSRTCSWSFRRRSRTRRRGEDGRGGGHPGGLFRWFRGSYGGTCVVSQYLGYYHVWTSVYLGYWNRMDLIRKRNSEWNQNFDWSLPICLCWLIQSFRIAFCRLKQSKQSRAYVNLCIQNIDDVVKIPQIYRGLDQTSVDQYRQVCTSLDKSGQV